MKKLLYTLVVATLALFVGVACTNDGGVTSFELGQVEVELGHQTGEASIPFTLSGKEAATGVVFGKPSAGWIHDLKADMENSKITFKYDGNCFHTASTETREASFTVKYGELEEVKVTVRQAALQQSPFTLTWSNVTPTSAKFTCTPDDPTEYYLIQLVEKTTIESVATSGTWEEKVYTWAKYMVDASYEECVNGVFPTQDILDRLPDINTFYNNSETEAYVYIIGCNMDFLPVVSSIGLYVPEFPTAPTLELANSAVEIGSEAVNGTNKLTVTGAGSFGSVVVRSTEAWLTASYDAATSNITYAASANAYNRTRAARVDVSYESAEGEEFAKVSFTVSQAANAAAEKYNFDLKIVETHWDRIVVSVNPSNSSVKYVVGADQLMVYNGNYEGDDNVLVRKVLSSDSKSVFSGAQTHISLPIVTNFYGLENWICYVFAVNEAENEVMSDVSKVSVEKVANDKPEVAWCDGEVYHVSAAGGTVVLGYKFVSESDPEGKTTQIVEGGGVRLNTYPHNGPISDDWGLLKKNPPVVDEVNRTVTFEINEYDPSKNYHYINVGITYYNKVSGTSYNSITIKIVQDAPAQ